MVQKSKRAHGRGDGQLVGGRMRCDDEGEEEGQGNMDSYFSTSALVKLRLCLSKAESEVIIYTRLRFKAINGHSKSKKKT